VGADLVGKLEAGIPEDDPRNPAVIADNVGDNVGDCAGMAADLFETYAVTMIASMLLGHLVFPSSIYAIILPLVIGSVSIIASILGIFFVRLGRKESIMAALYKGLAASSIFALIGFYFVAKRYAGSIWGGLGGPLREPRALSFSELFFPMAIGIFVTGLLVLITEYYTSKKFRPVKSIASASETGHATNLNIFIGFSFLEIFVAWASRCE
jgi:K(+)-stimulated pyrophosphate-energized sodium pump